MVQLLNPRFSRFRHGYRIDVQGAQDSVSGLEYERILSQMRVGGAMDEHEDRVSNLHVA